MNPADLVNLPIDPDTGEPVITFMTSPSMTDPQGNPVGFVSLVDNGANLRPLVAAKAKDPPSSGSSDDDGTTLVQRLLNKARAALGLASKGDAPTTFEAAVAVPQLREGLWTAGDGVREAIYNILNDEEIEDKRKAIGAALDGFKDFVMGLADQVLGVATASKAQAIAQAAAAESLDDWIRGRDPSPVSPWATAVKVLGYTPDPEPGAGGALQPPGGPSMNPTALKAAADLAAANAVELAQKLGVTDKLELAKIAAAASAEVISKAAMSGNPAVPTNALSSQVNRMNMGSDFGNAGNPVEFLTGALQGIAFGGKASKGADVGAGDIAQALRDLPDAVKAVKDLKVRLDGDGKDDPGLSAVVEKIADHLFPEKPKTTAAPNSAPPDGATTTSKGGGGKGKDKDTNWDGSAFGSWN